MKEETLEEAAERFYGEEDEVECNNCGYLMSLTEDESVYACYNSECTSCYEEYEEEPKQETLEEAAEKEYPTIHEQYQYDAFIEGAKWQQEQILDFLYSEMTERRDYSASKMCEKVIEFIEQFKK